MLIHGNLNDIYLDILTEDFKAAMQRTLDAFLALQRGTDALAAAIPNCSELAILNRSEDTMSCRTPDRLTLGELPHNTAFTGKIGTWRGLFWVSPQTAIRTSHVLMLEAMSENGTHAKPFQSLSLGAQQEVEDYEGPLDIRVSVRGFSQWGGGLRPGHGWSPVNRVRWHFTPVESHVHVGLEKSAKPRKHRAIRMRDEE